MAGTALLARLGTRLDPVRGRISADAMMDKITWFRVGGPAELLFQPADEQDLATFLQILPADIPVMVVGVGSNLLVRDGGIDGVVIRLSAKGFGGVEILSDNRLRVAAAVLDKKLAAIAQSAGIGGLEFYHGIPGGIGGALRMNAGANGTETTNRLIEVRAIDRAGKLHILSHVDMGYSYRHSAADDGLIFVSAVFQGVREDPEVIGKRMEAVQHHRETVQPIREKTGGSTFKNPAGHSSWKLIDAAGLRGFSVGGAQMSPMHCNFMINTGNASGYDLEQLGESVRRKVFEHSGVVLQWELKRLGKFRKNNPVTPFRAKTND